MDVTRLPGSYTQSLLDSVQVDSRAQVWITSSPSRNLLPALCLPFYIY